MENMARLADLESKLAESNIFDGLIVELHKQLNCIINNPNNEGARTITIGVLSKVHDCKPFREYMEYIGFEKVSDQFVFPKDKCLSKLKIAHEALDKKINYIKVCGRPVPSVPPITKEHVQSYKSVNPGNEFLEHIELLFCGMQKYESEDLQNEARKLIPLKKLKDLAVESVKEHEKERNEAMKAGGSRMMTALSTDMALLRQLVHWFKQDFFSWVNQPECKRCSCPTVHWQTVLEFVETETCRVEVYRCARCGGVYTFPRRNDPRALLATRRGRCGEWANCFTLICRAVGFETRYVYDVTDHVWCEVYLEPLRRWVHVDPCEGRIDTPLVYCEGWGKKMSYVLAFSHDDLQDVTWRYTTGHKEVLTRRTRTTEQDLLRTILSLREVSHAGLPPSRRDELARRTVAELAEMMVERKACPYEIQGRTSGSRAWRAARREIKEGFEFVFDIPDMGRIRYCASTDMYTAGAILKGWARGVWECRGVFRKVESDWGQVYLARNEGEDYGTISWRMVTAPGLKFVNLMIRAKFAQYENGEVLWSVQFDDRIAELVEINEIWEITREFRSVVIRAELSGGRGDVAWQHAQLFRQPLAATGPALDVQAEIVHE